MLRHLKKLFCGLPLATLVDFAKGKVTFRCDRELKVDTVDVRLQFGDCVFDAVIDVEDCDLREKLYRGQMSSPLEAVPLLEEAFPQDPLTDLLDPDRLQRVLRVRSPDLPDYQANSISLGTDGMLLTTTGSVQPGDQVRIAIEFDDGSWEPLDLTGQVLWSRPRRAREHLVEVRFVDMSRAQWSRLDEYVESRSKEDPHHQLSV